MQIRDFKLERFFAQHEFSARHLLCCSDCEAMTIAELLKMEDGAAQGFQQQWLGYTEAAGGVQLRQEIAGLYQGINADQILVHSGAQEAIFNFMNAVLEPGDHVIVESPCYQSLHEVARSVGCEVSPWRLSPQQGKWGLDFDELTAALKKNTRLIVINSPHNPTGYVLSRQEMENIVTLCRENKILLFSDEVYKYLEWGTEGTLPWACDLYENAVSLGVMSKSFGLPGLRIGWIATQNEEIKRKMAAFKDYTSICNSAPSEFLAELALRNRHQILERNALIMQENYGRLKAFFNRYPAIFTWVEPDGGPVAFPKMNQVEDAELVCLSLLQEKGVLLLPGKYYEDYPQHFRIGFGRSNFLEGLDLFDEYVQGKGLGTDPRGAC
jgi:aspartate/methionine/tyrosine aminotransferase